MPSGSSDSALTLSSTSVRSSTLSRSAFDSNRAASLITFCPSARVVAVWQGQRLDSPPHAFNESGSMKMRSNLVQKVGKAGDRWKWRWPARCADLHHVGQAWWFRTWCADSDDAEGRHLAQPPRCRLLHRPRQGVPAEDRHERQLHPRRQTSKCNVKVLQQVPKQSGKKKPGHYITLTTCTPVFTSRYRYVVWGELERVDKVDSDWTPPKELC
jgi:hypothetical protein